MVSNCTQSCPKVANPACLLKTASHCCASAALPCLGCDARCICGAEAGAHIKTDIFVLCSQSQTSSRRNTICDLHICFIFRLFSDSQNCVFLIGRDSIQRESWGKSALFLCILKGRLTILLVKNCFFPEILTSLVLEPSGFSYSHPPNRGLE